METFEEGTELVRVYLAASLREAKAVEDTLTAAEVDFAVEVEALGSSNALGLRTERQLAGFWIREADLDRAAGVLERAGQLSGLVKR
jgi:hypothetical protein